MIAASRIIYMHQVNINILQSIKWQFLNLRIGGVWPPVGIEATSPYEEDSKGPQG